MRSLLILALAASCSHKSAPTDQWCGSYVNELRLRAKGDVDWLKDESMRPDGAEELRAMVGSDPAIHLALEVCSDADGDTPAAWSARSLRLIDLQHKIAAYVIDHRALHKALDEAQAKQLLQLVEQLADTYTDPAPR